VIPETIGPRRSFIISFTLLFLESEASYNKTPADPRHQQEKTPERDEPVVLLSAFPAGPAEGIVACSHS